MDNFNTASRRSNYDSINDMIVDRNAILQELYAAAGLIIKLVGDRNQPCVMVMNLGDEPFAMSAYVQNFKYHLTSHPHDGETVDTIYLDRDTIADTADRLHEHIKVYEQRKLYRIQHAEYTDMYFNAVVPQESNKHVMWSMSDHRMYVSHLKAVNMQKYLLEYEGVETVIV